LSFLSKAAELIMMKCLPLIFLLSISACKTATFVKPEELNSTIFPTASTTAQKAPVKPDQNLAPGALCTKDDKDFHEFRYKEKIPYCRRVVSEKTKEKLYKLYEIPDRCRRGYTIDHLIPLSIGGSNNMKNLWPEPIPIKNSRKGIEGYLYHELRNGKITQKEAVQLIIKEKVNPNLDSIHPDHWLGFPNCE